MPPSIRVAKLTKSVIVDLPCRHLDGSRTRVHTALGSRWVLLVPPSTPGHEVQACAERARHRLGTDAVTVFTPPQEVRHASCWFARTRTQDGAADPIPARSMAGCPASCALATGGP